MAHAIESMQHARLLAPSDPAIALQLGRMYAKTGRWSDSVPLFEVATDDPDSKIQALELLVRAYHALRQEDKSANAMIRLGAVDPLQRDRFERAWKTELEGMADTPPFRK